MYYYWAGLSGEPLDSVLESIYLVVSLTFFQPLVPFPKDWHLQLFFFLMPVFGIGLLAQGVAEFGVLFFNRRARGKEWEMAVASTYSNHNVLIGLGHLGYQAMLNLLDLHQEVVVIELDPKSDLLEAARDKGVPVIVEDANRESALEAAGVKRAKSILLCTQNDSLNLQIAVKARALNPDIHVVVRIFDHDFAEAIRKQFGFLAVSSSQTAAPAFAAAAAELEVTRPVHIAGHSLRLAMLHIKADSKIANIKVEELEQKYDTTIVLLQHEDETDLHPAGDKFILENDQIVILAEKEAFTKLLDANG